MPGNAANPVFAQELYGGVITLEGEVVLEEEIRAWGGDPCLLDAELEFSLAEENTPGETGTVMENRNVLRHRGEIVFYRGAGLLLRGPFHG